MSGEGRSPNVRKRFEAHRFVRFTPRAGMWRHINPEVWLYDPSMLANPLSRPSHGCE